MVWGLVIRKIFATWPMTDEQVCATAAVMGAVAGAVVAWLSTFFTQQRSRLNARTPTARYSVR